jgi:TPR repeat protein
VIRSHNGATMEANRLIFGTLLAIGLLMPTASAVGRAQAQPGREIHESAVRTMNLLGIMFAEGEGVRKNARIAVLLFRESAMQGYTPAMANLGAIYEKGDAGPPNLHRAYAWLRAAVSFGVPEEYRDPAMLRLGMIAERLGRRKVMAAEKLASEIAASIIESCACSPAEETEFTSIGIT